MFSAFRMPRSFPSTCSLQVAHRREHFTSLAIRLIISASVQYGCVIRCRRFRDTAAGMGFYRWKLGFNQFRLHHARRTCGTSPYISSGLAAFPTCCFPLCLSTLGRLDVLGGISLSTSCSLRAVYCAPKRRTCYPHRSLSRGKISFE